MGNHSGHECLLRAYGDVGGNLDIFNDKKYAHLIVDGNKVCSSQDLDGLVMDAKETEDGVDIDFVLKAGYVIEKPVHLCFGVVPERGLQKINVKGIVEDNSSIDLMAYCVFPNSIEVRHMMEAYFEVGEGGHFGYSETHFHGNNGAIVNPKAKIVLKRASHFKTLFSLLRGRVGNLNIEYDVEGEEKSTADMTAKVYGSGEDKIRVSEASYLRGKDAKSLIKSRIFVKDKAESIVESKIEAYEAGARGHVDCIETILNNARARAIPIVGVFHEKAKVTHEASIGSVDKKQIETLMAHGLSEEDSIKLIVSGMLR